MDPSKYDDPEYCDCNRITRPLAEGEQLPDHICEDTRRASLEAWAERAGVRPGERASLRLGNGQSIECGRWIVVQDGYYVSDVVAVLQQWIEDGPEPKLVDLLRSQAGWRILLADLDDTLIHTVEPFLEGVFGPVDSNDPDDAGPGVEDLDEEVADYLSEFVIEDLAASARQNGSMCGFNMTPSMVRFAIADALDDSSIYPIEHLGASVRLLLASEPAPSRGLLVTSLLSAPLRVEPHRAAEPDLIVEIGGSSAWFGAALSRVRSVVSAHRTWANDCILRRLPNTHLPPGRPSSANAFDEQLLALIAAGISDAEIRRIVTASEIARYGAGPLPPEAPSIIRKQVDNRLRYLRKKLQAPTEK